MEDLKTGLVYNAAFDPALIVYDAQYQNEQAHSSHFRSHLNTVAEIVLARLGYENLVEVGCGKGYFLEMLQERGAAMSGFDPTYEGSNPAIQRCYFGAGLGIHCRGLILRHVLEHIPDPYHFLAALRDANSGQGLIYIEVPCLDWICKERAWFDIFYEHVNYFKTDRLPSNVRPGDIQRALVFGSIPLRCRGPSELARAAARSLQPSGFSRRFRAWFDSAADGREKTLRHLGRCLERRNILAFVREGRISCRQE